MATVLKRTWENKKGKGASWQINCKGIFGDRIQESRFKTKA